MEETEVMARQRWGSSLTRKRSACPDTRAAGKQDPEEEPQSVRKQFKKPKTDVMIVGKPPTESLGRELVNSKGVVNKSAIEAEVEARLAHLKPITLLFETEKNKKKKEFKADEESDFKTHAKYRCKEKTEKSISYTSISKDAGGFEVAQKQ